MYNVVYISLYLSWKVDIYVKMYAVRTENSNMWIVSEKEIKMAAKFQNVCPELTDINNHRFFFLKMYI